MKSRPRLTTHNRRKKIFLFLVADVMLISSALLFSFLLRFDGTIPQKYYPFIRYYIGISAALTIPLLFWRRLYSFTWAFVSLNEIVELLKVTVASGLLFTLLYYLFQDTSLFKGFPRSIIILHYSLIFLFLGSIRSAKRIFLLFLNRNPFSGDKKNALIIGSGERTDELIRTLQKNSREFNLVGILDDDPEKHLTILHGVNVLGEIAMLPDIAKIHNVQSVIIALPDAGRKTIQRTISLARKSNITDIKIIPTLYEVLQGKLTPETLRSVRVEDLLGRKVAHIETAQIAKFLKGKDVLITGAAGSIGSELCRQITPFNPRTLNLLDYEESNLFHTANLLKIDAPSQSIKTFLADIRNEDKIGYLIGQIRPQIVFHAAAYKHVPLMEEFPEEAVMTNVFGTLQVARATIKVGAEKFVLISTDKAVRPISIMGKTKKLAEMLVTALNERNPTNFVSVRFGNVLGSRGSVVPLFQEQLRRKGPITITDPRMTRFFMTAPEACLLVLEAGALGEGGEIFVLDMGKPVKIVELARELIRLSGFKPDRDIPIVYTKPRPGEKLFEDIFNEEEDMTATRYQKIFRAKTTYRINPGIFFNQLDKLKTYVHDRARLNEELTKLIR